LSSADVQSVVFLEASPNPHSDEAGWTGEDTVKVVEQFIKDIGMNIPLSEQGVKKSDFEQIIDGATGYMSGGMDLDPVPFTKQAVRKVLEESL